MIQVDPQSHNILESQNQAKNIIVALQSYPIKIWGKSVKGFLSSLVHLYIIENPLTRPVASNLLKGGGHNCYKSQK